MKLFSKSLAIAALAISALTITSCSKYDEGSKFTVLTAKQRISNDWKITVIETNGNNVTSYYPTISVDIKKDETFSRTDVAGNLTATYTGTWSFNGDKTKVTLTYSDNSTTTMDIVMLKDKSMKLKEVDGNETTIYTFEEK